LPQGPGPGRPSGALLSPRRILAAVGRGRSEAPAVLPLWWYVVGPPEGDGSSSGIAMPRYRYRRAVLRHKRFTTVRVASVQATEDRPASMWRRPARRLLALASRHVRPDVNRFVEIQITVADLHVEAAFGVRAHPCFEVDGRALAAEVRQRHQVADLAFLALWE